MFQRHHCFICYSMYCRQYSLCFSFLQERIWCMNLYDLFLYFFLFFYINLLLLLLNLGVQFMFWFYFNFLGFWWDFPMLCGGASNFCGFGWDGVESHFQILEGIIYIGWIYHFMGVVVQLLLCNSQWWFYKEVEVLYFYGHNNGLFLGYGLIGIVRAELILLFL